MACGMGDQVGEPLHGDRVAVLDERRYRVGERDDLGHAPGLPWRGRCGEGGVDGAPGG